MTGDISSMALRAGFRARMAVHGRRLLRVLAAFCCIPLPCALQPRTHFAFEPAACSGSRPRASIRAFFTPSYLASEYPYRGRLMPYGQHHSRGGDYEWAG